MATANPLLDAYNRTGLQREGISFDKAMETPMFKNCLQHIADAIHTIHPQPLPRKIVEPKCQQFKDS
jgi:hypothetical protein